MTGLEIYAASCAAATLTAYLWDPAAAWLKRRRRR